MDSKSQSRLKSVSKAIAILARIGQIFLGIGVGAIVIGMVLIPIVQKQIKIEDHVVTVFNKKIELEKREDKLVIKGGEKEQIITNISSEQIDMIMNAINEKNVRKLAISLEVALLFSAVQLVLTILTFGCLRKVFCNVRDGETPFIKENAVYLRKMGNYLVAVLIASLLSSIITQLIISADLSINVQGASIMTILCAFAASYIVEYGCVLQSKSKEKLYTD